MKPESFSVQWTSDMAELERKRHEDNIKYGPWCEVCWLIKSIPKLIGGRPSRIVDCNIDAETKLVVMNFVLEDGSEGTISGSCVAFEGTMSGSLKALHVTE